MSSQRFFYHVMLSIHSPLIQFRVAGHFILMNSIKLISECDYFINRLMKNSKSGKLIKTTKLQMLSRCFFYPPQVQGSNTVILKKYFIHHLQSENDPFHEWVIDVSCSEYETCFCSQGLREGTTELSPGFSVALLTLYLSFHHPEWQQSAISHLTGINKGQHA